MAPRKDIENGRLRRLPAAVIPLALCLLLALVAACESNDDTPTPGPAAASQAQGENAVGPAPRLLVPTPTPDVDVLPYLPWSVPPSLEEQVTSPVIVRATLASVTPSVETVSSGEGVAPTYRPVQTLRFTVHEYLKGSGPAVAVVVVRGDHTYLTEAEARRAANDSVARRNRTWDDREAVLYLATPPTGAAGGASGASEPAGSFTFILDNYTETPFDYSVDTLSRVWLPARDAPAAGGASGASLTPGPYITDGAASPPPTVSLADIKAAIADLAAELARGAGIEGYEDCMHGRISHERHRRAQPWTPSQETATLSSGSAAGTNVYSRTYPYRNTGYDNWWLSGPDMGLFLATIVDNDTDSSNGYDHKLTTARPLPAGSYRVHYNWQHHTDLPCNFKPTDAYRDWTVTVKASWGTVHEAFFDPVAVSGGVGAINGVVGSGIETGVLTPAEFTIGGVRTSLQFLTWQGGVVALSLSPAASLTGHALDFIALDGSVALSLDGGAAAGSAGALTWNVAAQPWQAGDQLMLRIRTGGTTTTRPTATPTPEPTATPTPEPTATPRPRPAAPNQPSAQWNADGTVSLDWNDVPDVTSYRVQTWAVLGGSVSIRYANAVTTFDGSSATVSGLTTEPQKYRFRVRAVNDVGPSTWSPFGEVVVPSG